MPNRSRRTWARAGLAGVLAFLVFHAPILRAVAWALVVSEPVERTDYVLAWSGDLTCQRAVDLVRRGWAQRVLLVQDEGRRITRMGIVPDRAQQYRALLNALGIPDDMIETIDGDLDVDWRDERVLAQWLQRRPDMRVIVLCDELESRRLRYVFDQVMVSTTTGWVRVEPLADRDLDIESWWKFRAGWKDLFYAWTDYVYARCFGPDEYVIQILSPEAYEARLEECWFAP